MCRIPHTRRINGRYVFRRRVHFRKIISKPLPVALRTADPAVARQRAAMLSACFVVVKASVDRMLECGRTLTGAEIEALFRAKLEEELSFYLHSAYEDASWSSSVQEVAAQEAEAYRVLRLPDRKQGMTEQDRAALRAKGRGADIGMIDDYIAQIRDVLSDEAVTARLSAIGAPAHAQNVAAARTHLIRAGAAACSRVQRLFDEDVLDAADPIRALMADLGEPSPDAVRLLKGEEHPAAVTASAPPPSECQFVIYDRRRFGDVIDEVLTQLKIDGVWKGDLKQQRRIMETFRWITGNRELGAYNHLDVVAFKTGLQRLPVSFRFGSTDAGPMSRPFAEVAAELPPLEPSERRNVKTINRDLSTISTVAKHLAQGAWKRGYRVRRSWISAARRSRSRGRTQSICARRGRPSTSNVCSAHRCSPAAAGPNNA